MFEDNERDEKIVYHYCSSATFLSIIKNKRIWLTSLTASNDKAEGWWGAQCFIDQLSDDPHFKDKRRLRLATYEVFNLAFRDRVALGSCFSSRHDLLSQWRGYADGGKGVCIGFSLERLQQLASQSREENLQVNLRKVRYDNMLSGETMKKVWDEFKLQIEEGASGSGGYMTFRKSYEGGGHVRETEVISELFLVKNPAFQEESEWRLFIVDFASGIQNINFRERNGSISPYLEFPFEDAIETITLGPLHPTPEPDIEKFISANCINAEIRRSRATLR